MPPHRHHHRLADAARSVHARYLAQRTTLAARLADDDRGEGVISAAIAVLIMAFLGAAMWVGFNEIWLNARDSTDAEVSKIGS
jgi:hypothetical protein